MEFIKFKKKYEKKEVKEWPNAVNQLPMVSICVQTYQHAAYIQECLDGILMQKTTFPFEILLGEDDSTDGTREICLEYAEKFPDKIRLYLHHRENNIKIGGQATGRFNFVYNLYSAKGKYIALCEGDDYWTNPLKLQKQVDFMEKILDFGICFHKVEVFQQTKSILLEDTITREVPEVTTIRELAKGNFIHTPSVLFRNDFKIPKWFLMTTLGDWSLYMTIIKDKKIIKLQDNMAVYRLHDQGIWSEKPQEERDKITLKAVKLIYKNLDMEEPTKQVILSRLIDPRSNSSKAKKFLSRLKKFLKR